MHDHKTCPNDETLVDFLENRLGDRRRSLMEDHLAHCADCRELAAVYTAVHQRQMQESLEPVPVDVTRRAVSAVQGLSGDRLLDTLAKGARHWMARGTQVLERLSWRPLQAAAVVRGRTDTLERPVIRREKQFDDLRVVVEIEKSGDDHATIRVTGDPAQQGRVPVRVALFRREREMASALLDETAVLFEEIPLGSYALVFVRERTPVGHYAFEITDQP